jgi:SAM-dependent methyltransferase
LSANRRRDRRARPRLNSVPPCLHATQHLALRFTARDYVTGDTFDVCGCSGCGLDVTVPAPTEAEMGSYYPPQYYGVPGARRFPSFVERVQRLLYDRRARAIEKFAGGRPGRVLDIGCGPGFQLSAFRRRGWEVHGTELSEHSAARARNVGIKVHVGPQETWPWPAGHFDAVVMWHTLEHWSDPFPVLTQVHRLLRDKGVLFVGVPNFASIEARLARDKWFHLDVPRHLLHFTPSSLTSALASTGFAVVRRSFRAPEYDCFSFVQTALNRFGIPHNLLYNILRGSGAKVRPSGGSLQAVVTIMAAAPLTFLSVPVTSLLALFGLGSALALYAQKSPVTSPLVGVDGHGRG